MQYNINKDIIIEEMISLYESSDKSSSGTSKAGVAIVGGGALAAKAAKAGMLGKAVGAAKLGGVALKAAKSGGALYVPGDSAAKSALYSGLSSAGGTALINGIGSAMGSGVPLGAVAVGSGMAGLQGGALGGIMHNTRDSLLFNAAIPAAVVAGAAPLTNMAFDAAGYPNVEVDPGISAALTGGVGAASWYLRNRNNKNKQYI